MAIAKKKKRFFDVEIPCIKKGTQILAMEEKELDGKYIKYDLTRMLKGKSAVLNAKIKIIDGEPVAIPFGLEIMGYTIRNLVRKGTDYAEDSFVTNCKDAEIIIKPLLVSRRRISKTLINALRKKAKEDIAIYAKDKSVEEIIDDLLKNKLQRILSGTLKKIYPLSLCEIRVCRVKKFLENTEVKTETKKKKGITKEVIDAEEENAKDLESE